MKKNIMKCDLHRYELNNKIKDNTFHIFHGLLIFIQNCMYNITDFGVIYILYH